MLDANIFTQKTKHEAVNTICSNLIMAEIITKEEVPNLIMQLNQYDSLKIAIALLISRQCLDVYFERFANRRRN